MEKANCTNCGTDNNRIAKYCSGCGFELPKLESKIAENIEPKKTTEKSEKRKKIISAVVGAIAFVLSYFAAQHFFFEKPSFDKVMVEVASEINKTCPIMVDQDTRLDNTVAMPNNIFQYNYTLVNMVKSEVNSEDLKNYIEPVLINTIRTNPDMKIYRDNKITLAYNYKDKNGVFILKINITPDHYQ